MRRIAVVGPDYDLLVVAPAPAAHTQKRSLAVFPMGRGVLADCIRTLAPGGVTFCNLKTLPARNEDLPVLFLVHEKSSSGHSRVCIQRMDRVLPFELQIKRSNNSPVIPVTKTWEEHPLDAELVVAYYNSPGKRLPLRYQRAHFPPAIVLLAALERDNDRDCERAFAKLVAKWRGPKIVVTNANSLANLEVPIRLDGSWEEFANNVRDALHTPGVMKYLSECDYLIVRSESSAVVLVDKDKQTIKLFYPGRESPILPRHQGFLVGSNSLLTSSIATALQSVNPVYVDQIEEGVCQGVKLLEIFQAVGYTGSMDYVDPQWHVKVCECLKSLSGTTIHCVNVPRRKGHWSIAQQIFARKAATSAATSTTVGTPVPQISPDPMKAARDIAIEIVSRGADEVCRKHGIPFLPIGKAIVVSRREFEQYAEIQAAMRAYLRIKRPEKPLSLAVFGKPGGGKSFGVKQLAGHLEMPELHRELIEANVSQFRSVEELAVVLHRSRDIALTGKVPVVFWDEFDSIWDGRPFGLFRYFLAPMQDGRFQHGSATFTVGPAIFVFIGGVNHTFEMFEGRMREQEFIEAKGPDFISRLQGYLNVLGISGDDKDATHLLHRAILLHGFIRKHQPAVVDAKDKSVQIDARVVRSFLGVKDFKHGVRSLEAIIQMCRIGGGQKSLTWASLPADEQLETHVSVREFYASGASTL